MTPGGGTLPLNKGRWMAELCEDADKEFLLYGIVNGFQLIPANSALAPAEMDNYRSSTKPEARAKVEETIRDEIHQGNYITTQEKPTIVSAIGAVSKANSDELRLIHDCSMPEGLGLIHMSPPWISYIFRPLMMRSSL